MCKKPAKWQINRPEKPSATACNDHLGGMIEGMLPKEPGVPFSFNLMYVHGIPNFSATCLHEETGAGVHVALEVVAGTEKVIKGPELTPALSAVPLVEVK